MRPSYSNLGLGRHEEFALVGRRVTHDFSPLQFVVADNDGCRRSTRAVVHVRSISLMWPPPEAVRHLGPSTYRGQLCDSSEIFACGEFFVTIA